MEADLQEDFGSILLESDVTLRLLEIELDHLDNLLALTSILIGASVSQHVFEACECLEEAIEMAENQRKVILDNYIQSVGCLTSDRIVNECFRRIIGTHL